MRRRSTFLHDPKLEVDPRQLYLSGDRFVIENLRAAREERLTVGLDELPEELCQVLRQSHELHIRWASEDIYDAIPPFVSKISPGLHVFYTPLQRQSGDLLCPLLHKVFSSTLKCRSPLSTFTTPHLRSGRFASTSSLQYHSLLPSLNSLTQYIQRYLCKHSDQQCLHSAPLLNVADTVDIDYDSISHILIFTAHWSRPPAVLYDPLTGRTAENGWSLSVDTSANAEKVEVGVLGNEPPTDPSEISLSGFLTVVGEDDHPKPTLFSFPSRHHALPPSQSQDQRYKVSFLQPTGLHPKMQISFPTASALKPPANKPADSACALHTYLTLPSALFADKYQLSATADTAFMQSHHLTALRAISGETDLEAPDYVVEKWGSNLLVELAVPPPSSSSRKLARSTPPNQVPDSSSRGWNVTIPLHLRYFPPSPTGYSTIDIPNPILFWACTAEEGTKFPVNPFDRVNLGYEGLFGGRTMFYHLDPAPGPDLGAAGRGEEGSGRGKLVQRIRVPVLNMEAWGAEWVEWGTVAVVMLGFLWVVCKLWASGLSVRGEAGPKGVGGRPVEADAREEEEEEEEHEREKKKKK
ncbi:hypothetical protein GJ744_010874 [Endocarpon pusillum]|uniref:Protein PBN1 n=1 Tax=Endocarpon pusillum TaxID=364733 RepID=A0A8H7E2P5_9EURO|nr:hypothetical protein GJ744_010874 [Endocarpon pusillum]